MFTGSLVRNVLCLRATFLQSLAFHNHIPPSRWLSEERVEATGMNMWLRRGQMKNLTLLSHLHLFDYSFPSVAYDFKITYCHPGD